MKPDRLIEDLTLVPLPQWWENPWLLFSLPVVIGLIAYNLRRWWLQRKPKTLTVTVPDGPPPHEAFLARLAALRSKRGHWIAYPFAIEVSEILRGYLEARYAFSVRFQTSREFLELAATNPCLNTAHRATLRDFLSRCDLLKFAQGVATEAELAALIDTTEQFISECAGLPPGHKGGNP
jgi:hypothetical protein